MYDFTEKEVRKQLDEIFHEEAIIHLCHPFGDMNGPSDFYDKSLKLLFNSMPDFERRDYIVVPGKTEKVRERQSRIAFAGGICGD